MYYKSTHACSPIMCVGWEVEMLPTLLYMYNTSFIPRRSPTRSVYSGTPLNGHPSIADTYDITDNSESPDCIAIFSVY